MSAKELLQAAAGSSDANQARRLLALAAIRDGMSRQAAARIGGMDRQSLRDWVHAFNKFGLAGLVNDTSPGRPCKLSMRQKATLKSIVEAGPDPSRDGVVRWRCRDLVRTVEAKFGVSLSEDTIARTLRVLGFSHITARPKHPEQKKGVIEGFKKIPEQARKGATGRSTQSSSRDLVPRRDAHRPEEWLRATMGQARDAPPPTRRSTVRKRLCIRRRLPCAR
jgi:transposase